MWEKDWEKKHQEASMNVVYVSNENYVRHMAASMVSLFERNQGDKQLTVYVFHKDQKRNQKETLPDGRPVSPGNQLGGAGRS